MTTFSKSIDEKQIVFLTGSRLIDFFKDDRHLLHAIRYEEGQNLLIKLENALPSFLYSGRQDELYSILTNLVKIAIGLKNYSRLNFQIESIIKLFAEKEFLYIDVGQRDHWLHVILVNLFCHLLAELDVNNFPPGRGQEAVVGGRYPLGEVIGNNLPSPKGFVGNARYDREQILSDPAVSIVEPDTKERLFAIDAVNRYFFDWGLTLTSLFHDCAYPFSSKLIAKFYEKINELREDYKNTFKGIVKFDFPKGSTNVTLPSDVFKSNQFNEFSELLETFYFCSDPKHKISSNHIKERMEQFEHDVLSAFFVYLVKDDLLCSQINEEDEFDKNIKLDPIIKGHLIKALKAFYLDSAIHAIAFHHTPLEIKWEWNPILYLLRIADVACSFARPEIEELRGRMVKLEGIKFGVAGREFSASDDKGLIKIFIGFDYRNKFLSAEKTEAAERDILSKIWEKDLKDQISNLEKLSWMEIGTQLLGKFNINFKSP